MGFTKVADDSYSAVTEVNGQPLRTQAELSSFGDQNFKNQLKINGFRQSAALDKNRSTYDALKQKFGVKTHGPLADRTPGVNAVENVAGKVGDAASSAYGATEPYINQMSDLIKQNPNISAGLAGGGLGAGIGALVGKKKGHTGLGAGIGAAGGAAGGVGLMKLLEMLQKAKGDSRVDSPGLTYMK